MENIIEETKTVKSLERSTNHDVKAVEYYLRDNFKKDRDLNQFIPYIHFGCTSEDINNLAYSTMLKEARDCFILPSLESLSNFLRILANQFATIGMLSRTHGQPASPTTMGKELANFVHRLECQSSILSQIQLKGKLNGAVGNYNAFQISHPKMDWPEVSSEFILELGLEPNERVRTLFARLAHSPQLRSAETSAIKSNQIVPTTSGSGGIRCVVLTILKI